MLEASLILTSSAMFRLRGSGMKRWIWVVWMVFVCSIPQSYLAFFCLLWVHIVLGIFPTQSLFSAIHGDPPSRRDKWPFYYLQDSIVYHANMGRVYGIAYGVVRGALAVPAVIFLASINLWCLVFLIPVTLHGAIYYYTKSVKNSEYIIGAILGLMVVSVW
jgi:hypothetical protein